MKINFSSVLLDLSSRPIVVEGSENGITLSDVATSALNSVKENGLDAKRAAFALMIKVANGGIVELDVTDAAKILKAIAESPYTPIVVGRCDELLSGKTE